MEGWIKLNRSIQDHWLCKDEPFDKTHAWIDLLLLANYEDKKTAYKGDVITCKRGDVNLSLSALASRWKWSRPKVSRFIELLERDGMITTNVTTHRTTISIVNYGFYQGMGTTNVTTNVTANVQQTCTTNKRKKDKNIRSISESNRFNQFEKTYYDFDEIERLMQ